MKKLPFGIDFVIEQDLVPIGTEKIPNSKGYSIDCPFCAMNGLKPDTRHKYSVDIYQNVGHCMRCGSGHGIIGLHQALSKKPISMDEARDDLYRRWNGLSSDVRIGLSEVQEHLEIKRKKQLFPAPIEIRDEVYRAFLDRLSLSGRHRDDLIARGLTEEEIEKGMYRTVPAAAFMFAARSFPCEAADALGRHRRWGIPGFYDIRTNEPKAVCCGPGYFVPVRNGSGEISGMQIRYDPLPDDAPEEKKERWAKYRWFSSGFMDRKEGCTASGCENIHYACRILKVPESIILTEGVLKADVASCLAGRIRKDPGGRPVPVLGLAGIHNYENLGFELAELKGYGLRKVVLAVDMDYREKVQVAQAMRNIEGIITGLDLECSIFRWDPGYKGIDDYFLAVYKRRQEMEEIPRRSI